MPNKLEQLIVDVPLGELARNALNESVEAIPFYTKDQTEIFRRRFQASLATRRQAARS